MELEGIGLSDHKLDLVFSSSFLPQDVLPSLREKQAQAAFSLQMRNQKPSDRSSFSLILFFGPALRCNDNNLRVECSTYQTEKHGPIQERQRQKG